MRVVMFTSLFCVPCQATRRVLADVQRLLPWLPVEELDVAAHPDLAEAESIRSTPTILVRAGDRQVLRAEGVPTAPQVLQAVVRAMDGPAPAGPSGASGRPDPA
ncbi:Glutaredoxin [Clavibacter michiganensis subsp. michiganensis]|uniref:Glutaredoxin n=2 Tax=Clavibacter michiganensis TaxID=28447 RepID=A0A1Y3FKT1_CLAMM|nr:Glutaredoxin [Clavibacter michiganensis subsp. michiganensis]SLJ91989.1 Glutaredoxin [Clavibacter michiganensis]OUD82795.1 Glutaredoxin [Clavibacter michiganensis subsp. michiganensis]OUD85535.1 Glutaredoxin [Clavibacter michiganensis subsp. michiganensis]OUD94064.1 Glutaredoxin [Clavibacter michiganensis subsp. michiganensis]